MKIKFISFAVVSALALSGIFAFAAGGGSGPKTYRGVGKIGAVQMNPYKVAPLTAIIRNAGYTLTDIKVVVKAKKDGVDIAYDVSNQKALQHGGIPIWGLYPDYVNEVEVSYKRNGEAVKESYKIYAPNIAVYGSGTGQKQSLPNAVITKDNPKYHNNIYLMNHLSSILPNAAQVTWNNPIGGALEWDYESYVWAVDGKGDIRWFLKTDEFRDPDNIKKKGNMMGFDQTANGDIIWGQSQMMNRYDLMGRKIFQRELPKSYIDFSHHMEETSNGTFLLRVASADYKRADGKNVRSVRDVIIELDANGNVIDEWKIMDILDPYRDVNLLALDQGAVCLNVDASKAGQTASKEEMEDEKASFGDVTGVGVGRNWAHINSVNYDAHDDSIIISVRNQSAVVKITRDKKVKWILASKEGWTGELAKKVLTPIDSKGNKIDCGASGSKCPGYENEKGGFDYTWTQHTAYKVNEKSKGDKVHISVFDNGDSRGMEQPAMINMKYSRAVEYVVDEKNMTVEQVWEYGKQRGFEWYSPITSVTEYIPSRNTMFIYSATAGLGDVAAFRAGKAQLTPYLEEIKYGTQEVEFEMKFVNSNTIGYRSLPIDIQKTFK
ncbi:aryl-sulfate sulfotransferase [Campylobacter sp. faydin G-105]|uniref:aryl-sulfate sulfotransferase n=1 Tax=Campylobacter anatolicus TaxID=2829105 RepID=UPI001B925A1C|nr:aryl-sulfate sulfotransferase [Campylobacter anatolicus]MBR8461955.1 aryl-sulfate sulfotransferase [Campylobacter anatolicus]